MFLSGATQEQAELRPPSIRGALRFWFRAMMGWVVGGDVKKVKTLEALVWGDTEAASRVRVRVCEQHLDFFDPNKQPAEYEQLKGLIYFSQPYMKRERGQGQRWNRPYIKPESSFTVATSLSSDKTLQDVIEGTMWLLAHFGGLGGRTRRGFGSLCVQLDPSAVLKPGSLSYQPSPDADLKDYFKKNLEAIRHAFTEYAGPALGSYFSIPTSGAAPAALPTFSSFVNWRTVLVEIPKASTWKDVMSIAGQELRAFREDSRPAARMRWVGQKTHDYMNAVNDFYNGTLSSPVRLDYDAFGLPIQYQSSSRQRAKASLQWHYNNDDQLQDRRASPLIIRPLGFDARAKWCIALHLFRAEFLPSRALECLTPSNDWPPGIPKPTAVDLAVAGLSKVETFLDKIKKDYGGVELL